jgi:hypothetical protein
VTSGHAAEARSPHPQAEDPRFGRRPVRGRRRPRRDRGRRAQPPPRFAGARRHRGGASPRRGQAPRRRHRGDPAARRRRALGRGGRKRVPEPPLGRGFPDAAAARLGRLAGRAAPARVALRALEAGGRHGQVARGRRSRGRGRGASEPAETERDRYVEFYEGLERAIRAAGPPPVPREAGVETLRVIEAARRSSEERAAPPWTARCPRLRRRGGHPMSLLWWVFLSDSVAPSSPPAPIGAPRRPTFGRCAASAGRRRSTRAAGVQ